MLTASDIKDDRVRQWFFKKENSGRRWLTPVIKNHTRKNSHYLNWVFNEVIPKTDFTVVLLLDPIEEEMSNFARDNLLMIPAHGIRIKDELVDDYMNDLLQKHEINSFFCHASFHKAILKFRELLNSPKWFDKILSVWFEGGFLRGPCKQFDWHGWNGLSSLADLDLNKIPDLSLDQQIYLKWFMEDKFYPQKINTDKTIFSSLKDIVNHYNISNSYDQISVIGLQVENDSVIKQFANHPKYHSCKWAFEFAEANPTSFFIIKEHPKQISTASHLACHKNGPNWVYDDTNSCDTISLCRYANSVVVVNSTVGCEALYWTRVFRAGKSVYSHDQISFDINQYWTDDIKFRNNIEKFLYYLIMNFHYTHGVNANSLTEWFDNIDIQRKLLGCHLKGTIALPEPPKSFRHINQDISFMDLPDKTKSMVKSIMTNDCVRFGAIPDQGSKWFSATQKKTEILDFLDIVKNINPEIIVETGLNQGGTHVLFKDLAKKVISIEHMWFYINLTIDFLRKFDMINGSYFVWGDSTKEKTKDSLSTLLDGKTIDMLFIDASHRKDDVKKDYELYSPFVKKGGIIAFHDYSVLSSVKEFVDNFASFKVIESSGDKAKYGIAYLIK